MTLYIDSIASALGEERIVPPKFFKFLGKAEEEAVRDAKLVRDWTDRKVV